MELQKDREELIEMLNAIKNHELMARLKSVLTELVLTDDFSLSQGHKDILDHRIEKYRNGGGKTFTWNEVVSEARNQ